MPDLNTARQTESLAFLERGCEFVFGEPGACPLPLDVLVDIHPGTLGVEQVLHGGLTAWVFKLRVGGRCFAIKRARPECKVQNPDGATSFLNELRRHAEIDALRARGIDFPGVVRPDFGSLRKGLVVSPWIEGEQVSDWDVRRLEQVFEAGRVLIENGFFEWDFCSGNVLDDGRHIWLFDFGYMYRFDPLRQMNTAGTGLNVPQFHLAERIETRNLFAWLLRIESAEGVDAALAAYRLVKEVALVSYGHLIANLRGRAAREEVLDWLRGFTTDWQQGLRGDLAALYLREAWRSHRLDLDDDLHGKTCTATTLRRCDWLLSAIERDHALLKSSGALSGEEATLDRAALGARYRALRSQAERYQHTAG
ncbi:hypothetical protein [Niveibacterium sp. SC-1]|uniref:hypothetical protein n=1 Tax=Niveibacterium sp. SC-1 TaxID=3135646 RepID=UPI00311D5E5E